MSDKEHCQNHPDEPVTARCVRFNRRYCDKDFEDEQNPVECLSEGTYCEYRSQCLIWEKIKKKKREQRRLEAERVKSEGEAGTANP